MPRRHRRRRWPCGKPRPVWPLSVITSSCLKTCSRKSCSDLGDLQIEEFGIGGELLANLARQSVIGLVEVGRQRLHVVASQCELDTLTRHTRQGATAAGVDFHTVGMWRCPRRQSAAWSVTTDARRSPATPSTRRPGSGRPGRSAARGSSARRRCRARRGRSCRGRWSCWPNRSGRQA